MASTIKVDNVQNTPGTNIASKCGTTVTVGAASDNIRSAGNNLQASDGGNLISQCGTTVTLGASGDTVSLASGASQSGFGRAGSVDWDTASIKTAGFSAVSGNGYFCNTNGGIFTVSLPAGSAGDIVALADYTRTFNTNNLTVSPDGSEKIGGVAADAVLDVNGQSATFVYVDSTEGWINTQETQTSQTGTPPFVVATGGTPCTGAIVCSDYKQHTFTGPGTFTVTNGGDPTGSTSVDYLVIAGGGGGGYGAACNHTNGAGGAGGYRESPGAASGCYTVSPRGAAPAAAVVVSASPGSYTIAIGAGGAGVGTQPVKGCPGSLSSALCISSAGGGGSGKNPAPRCGQDGGSGGGGSSNASAGGGSGNTPPTNPVQGMPGGAGLDAAPSSLASGGGGGAVGAGANGTAGCGGNGGTGGTSSIDGTPTGRAGGGGGGSNTTGGTATCGGGSFPGPSMDGTVNTGGGGASASANTPSSTGGSGASGVVIIRYKFQ